MSMISKFLCVFLWFLALVGCAAEKQRGASQSFIIVDPTIPGEEINNELAIRGVRNFQQFFADVSVDSVRGLISELYAEHVWFNDTLKTMRGRDEVEEYFLKTTEHVDFIRAEVVDSAISGRNCYVRWVMDVRFKGQTDTVQTIGMTLLRFNRQGQVVLHQDFWDSSAGFYEHLPVLGGVLRWIKSKI